MRNEKTDIVYLWCNINDPEFRKRKETFARGLDVHPQANNICRYSDNGELKYSLRSLEKYAPWINKVFIVTDSQIPDWLNLNHPKVKIINHNDILPEGAKPCFNSIAIEHCIADIPELSEYFLYANDDMFFNSPVGFEFFFNKKGYPISRFRKKRKKDKINLYSSVLENAENLIFQKYKVLIGSEPHHNIDAYRKSDVLKCREIFRKKIDKTIQSHFRSPDNIERAIYQKYFVATGHGEFKKVSRVDTGLPLIVRLFNLLRKKYQKDSCLIFPNHHEAEEIIEKFSPKLFCINDTEETTPEDRKCIKTFLENRFPNKSGFEI